MKTTYGKWFKVDLCNSCHTPLRIAEIKVCEVCPYCGATSINSDYIPLSDHPIIARRTVKTWWDWKFPFYHTETTYEQKSR